MTPVLEELSEFEVELPARCRSPLPINFVEPIPDVHAQGSKWAYCADPESKASEESGWIELTWLQPVVSTLEERIEIERLIDSESQLARSHKERVSERRESRL